MTRKFVAALCVGFVSFVLAAQPAHAAGLGVLMYQPGKTYTGQKAKIDIRTAPQARCTLNGGSPINSTLSGAATWTWTTTKAGSFKITVACSKGATSGSATKYLTVLPTWHNVVTYSGTGELAEPKQLTIPTKSYRVKYSYTCTDATAPYWLMAWEPINSTGAADFDGFYSERPAGSGYWGGSHGGRTGMTFILADPSCTWWAVVQAYR